MTPTLAETHRSFVNTWECDENDHLNVQFYLKRFDEAARLFALQRGGAHDSALPATRHVRYHAELRRSQSVVIRSGVVGDGPYAGWRVHLMIDNVTGALCATALDGPAPLAEADGAVEAQTVDAALPRSIEGAPQSPLPGEAILAMGGLVAHRCIITPLECDARGALLEQFYVARFTDGAPHVWDHAGLGTEWLTEHGLGRVAVEMKISHHGQARAGDALHLYSVPTAIEGKTLRLRHEIVRATDNAPVASGEVVALVMDLKTRRAVPMPGEAAERMHARLQDRAG